MTQKKLAYRPTYGMKKIRYCHHTCIELRRDS